MNATTVKTLSSVKTATAEIKCTMAAEESYKVWYQMMREMADKDIKRERELENAKRGTELANNMLAAQIQKQKECEDEIKRLKHELHQSKTNNRNVPTNLLDERLGRFKTVLEEIADTDISGKKSFMASKAMKELAEGVLSDE